MLKVGVIGSGFGTYGLLPAFANLKECQVVALCAHDSARVKKALKRYRVPHYYQDWRTLLKEEPLDAIAIAVTPSAQASIIQTALKKKLHIFAEKPLTTSLKKARILLELAQKENVVHAVDFIFPEIAAWVKAKAMIDAQVIGQPLQFSQEWNFLSYDIAHQQLTWKTKRRNGGGAAAFYFSHALYYLEFFFGRITQLQSRLSYDSTSLGGAETGIEALLAFKQGVIGTAQLSCRSRGYHRHRLTIWGERGTLVIENDRDVSAHFYLDHYDSQGKKKHLTFPLRQNDEDERVVPVKRLAQRFVTACVRGESLQPSFKAGVRVQELIEQIYNQQK